jgi:prepilin-type N-terminal cleavage/methylation domain-containing protein/prepilin-type processing-associated H-X9-DG protein
MRNKQGFTLIEMLTVITIIGILAAILFPVFSNARKKARGTTCQNNMTQVAKAIKTYLGDYDDTYPTNRLADNSLVPDVPLSASGQLNQNGVNWVEGLYKYSEPAGATPAEESAWTCPNASISVMSAQNDANTYALNINLLEQPEGSLRNPVYTLLLREMDRRCGSVCRPQNITNTDAVRPQFAFLTTVDQVGTTAITTNPNLHSSGSNIVFADGHVKYLAAGLMPPDNDLVWDLGTKQWWNPQKTIALNP